MSDIGIWSPADSIHQTVDGSQFMIQHQGMQLTPSHLKEWRNSSGHGMRQSPENVDYYHIPYLSYTFFRPGSCREGKMKRQLRISSVYHPSSLDMDRFFLLATN
ncbi:AT-hook motif nuclear-localized protein [Forsythia ovata]|uniref:AT-hook motif nuclear-localized protein n=1 Tax=Forsythia ovata TaxID=205694 RepID=A0ABD1T814_9LAMI